MGRLFHAVALALLPPVVFGEAASGVESVLPGVEERSDDAERRADDDADTYSDDEDAVTADDGAEREPVGAVEQAALNAMLAQIEEEAKTVEENDAEIYSEDADEDKPLAAKAAEPEPAAGDDVYSEDASNEGDAGYEDADEPKAAAAEEPKAEAADELKADAADEPKAEAPKAEAPKAEAAEAAETGSSKTGSAKAAGESSSDHKSKKTTKPKTGLERLKYGVAGSQPIAGNASEKPAPKKLSMDTGFGLKVNVPPPVPVHAEAKAKVAPFPPISPVEAVAKKAESATQPESETAEAGEPAEAKEAAEAEAGETAEEAKEAAEEKAEEKVTAVKTPQEQAEPEEEGAGDDDYSDEGESPGDAPAPENLEDEDGEDYGDEEGNEQDAIETPQALAALPSGPQLLKPEGVKTAEVAFVDNDYDGGRWIKVLEAGSRLVNTADAVNDGGHWTESAGFNEGVGKVSTSFWSQIWDHKEFLLRVEPDEDMDFMSHGAGTVKFVANGFSWSDWGTAFRPPGPDARTDAFYTIQYDENSSGTFDQEVSYNRDEQEPCETKGVTWIYDKNFMFFNRQVHHSNHKTGKGCFAFFGHGLKPRMRWMGSYDESGDFVHAGEASSDFIVKKYSIWVRWGDASVAGTPDEPKTAEADDEYSLEDDDDAEAEAEPAQAAAAPVVAKAEATETPVVEDKTAVENDEESLMLEASAEVAASEEGDPEVEAKSAVENDEEGLPDAFEEEVAASQDGPFEDEDEIGASQEEEQIAASQEEDQVAASQEQEEDIIAAASQEEEEGLDDEELKQDPELAAEPYEESGETYDEDEENEAVVEREIQEEERSNQLQRPAASSKTDEEYEEAEEWNKNDEDTITEESDESYNEAEAMEEEEEEWMKENEEEDERQTQLEVPNRGPPLDLDEALEDFKYGENGDDDDSKEASYEAYQRPETEVVEDDGDGEEDFAPWNAGFDTFKKPDDDETLEEDVIDLQFEIKKRTKLNGNDFSTLAIFTVKNTDPALADCKYHVSWWHDKTPNTGNLVTRSPTWTVTVLNSLPYTFEISAKTPTGKLVGSGRQDVSVDETMSPVFDTLKLRASMNEGDFNAALASRPAGGIQGVILKHIDFQGSTDNFDFTVEKDNHRASLNVLYKNQMNTLELSSFNDAKSTMEKMRGILYTKLLAEDVTVCQTRLHIGSEEAEGSTMWGNSTVFVLAAFVLLAVVAYAWTKKKEMVKHRFFKSIFGLKYSHLVQDVEMGGKGGNPGSASEGSPAQALVKDVLTKLGFPGFTIPKYTAKLQENHITTVEQLKSLDDKDWQRLEIEIPIRESIRKAIEERDKPISPTGGLRLGPSRPSGGVSSYGAVGSSSAKKPAAPAKPASPKKAQPEDLLTGGGSDFGANDGDEPSGDNWDDSDWSAS